MLEIRDIYNGVQKKILGTFLKNQSECAQEDNGERAGNGARDGACGTSVRHDSVGAVGSAGSLGSSGASGGSSARGRASGGGGGNALGDLSGGGPDRGVGGNGGGVNGSAVDGDGDDGLGSNGGDSENSGLDRGERSRAGDDGGRSSVVAVGVGGGDDLVGGSNGGEGAAGGDNGAGNDNIGSGDLALDPCGGGVAVEVEVVQVVGNNVSASADGVLSNTVVVVLGSPGGKVGQLVGRTREKTVVGSTAELVVGLVGSVSGVTEGGDSDNLLAELRVDVKVGRGDGHAVLEESTASTTENVTDDLGTLGVTADNQLGVGAASAVGVELSNAVGNTLVDRLAVGSLNRVVEKDILVVAVLKAIADGVDELALATGVGFVVTLEFWLVHKI
jgi:hypothetical protein